MFNCRSWDWARLLMLGLCFATQGLLAQTENTTDNKPENPAETKTAANADTPDVMSHPSFALKTSLLYLWQGSYMQFSEINNLYYAGAAVPALWYSFEHDERLSNLARTKEIHNIVDHVGDGGVIFNFPVLPIGAYYLGRSQQDHRLVQFAMEYFAANYLALVESGLMSYIHIHKRPEVENNSFWEEAFRSDSSFPSGHIVPYATLFFKTMQFYGPYWSIIPLGLTVLGSMQRVQDGKHYVSDVVGAFFLSAFASEGVRTAAKYQHNHPFYKWVFEHDMKLGLLTHGTALGPKVSWDF